jgi:hypothetical protein
METETMLAAKTVLACLLLAATAAAAEPNPGVEKAVVEMPAEKAADKPDGGQTAETVGAAGPFQLDIEVFPEKEVMPYDPIFFRVFLTNKGKETVLAYVVGAAGGQGSTIQLLGEHPGSSLEYPGPSAECVDTGTFHFAQSIPAGESFMQHLSYIDHIAPLCVRPRTPDGEPFLRKMGSEFRVRAQVSVTAAALGRPLAPTDLPHESLFSRQDRYMKVYAKGRSPVCATSPKIRIRQRPAAELRLIEEAVKNAEERYARWNVGTVKNTFPWPYPERCLTLVPDRYNTPTGLKDYEKQLSPGTFRDTVHFYRLMRTLFEEGDEAKGLAIVDELLAWLSTLPEVERQGLAVQVKSIFPSNKLKQKVYFELLYGLADRLPARYQMRDYRDSYLRRCCPGYAEAFAAFLWAKGEQYPWIDQWLNPTPAPAKTTPSGNSPTPAATKKPASEKSPPPATTQPGRKN